MSKSFSQKELEEIKNRLLKTEKGLLKRIDLLKKEDPFSDPDHVSDNAAVDTDVREQEGHDRIEAQIKDLTEKLNNVRLAVKKINQGRYGVCERCQGSIPKNRLKLLPEARFCVDCERAMKIGV